jgi:hypothetical protein
MVLLKQRVFVHTGDTVKLRPSTTHQGTKYSAFIGSAGNGPVILVRISVIRTESVHPSFAALSIPIPVGHGLTSPLPGRRSANQTDSQAVLTIQTCDGIDWKNRSLSLNPSFPARLDYTRIGIHALRNPVTKGGLFAELQTNPACKKCGSTHTRASHRRFWEKLFSRFFVPFRCRACDRRFWERLSASRIAADQNGSSLPDVTYTSGDDAQKNTAQWYTPA